MSDSKIRFQFESILGIDLFNYPMCGNNLLGNMMGKNLTLICGDSTAELTLKKAKMLGPYDLVFIDANHTYEYVKKDYENYRDKVKPGGIIAFHDVNFEGDRYGSPQVLRETGLDWTFISYSAEVGIAYRIKE